MLSSHESIEKVKKEIGAKEDCRIATCDDSLKISGAKRRQIRKYSPPESSSDSEEG